MRFFAAAGALACALAALAGPARADEVTPEKYEHPGTVALIEESADNWKYVHFPSSLRLYVFDGDRQGVSACYTGCASAWPPLLAEDADEAVGDWTIIQRGDGRRQWAYQGRPVYLRFHDSVAAPSGDGVNGTWHFLKP